MLLQLRQAPTITGDGDRSAPPIKRLPEQCLQVRHPASRLGHAETDGRLRLAACRAIGALLPGILLREVFSRAGRGGPRPPITCIGNSATFRRPLPIPRSTAYALGVPRAQRLVASVGRLRCPSWPCRFASEHAPLAAPARSTCALAGPISAGIARPIARCRRLPNREVARARIRRPRPGSAHVPWSAPARFVHPDRSP